jgi:signal transduction histidine kinase/ActR/RegA family two-component response regulator
MPVDPQQLHSEPHPEVGALIQRDTNLIIERWQQRAVLEQPKAARLHHAALLDHLPTFLLQMGRTLSAAIYEGNGWHGPPADEHGEQRWEHGWSLAEVVRDYQILRLVLVEHLEQVLTRPLHGREIMAIGLVLDEAITVSVSAFNRHQQEASRRQAEQERQEAADRHRRQREALQEAHRRKDEFLAVLGHELRNALAPLRNALHVLHVRGADPPTVAWAHEVAARQTHHLTRLVDDLLDVSRIGRGKILLRNEEVDLARLIGSIAADHQRLVEGSGLTLETELPAGSVWVRGDPVRLTQVVGNLLHNAAKFTDPGGRIQVRVALAEEGRRAEITVRDTGIGITPEMLPRVFELFAQAEQSLSRSRGGLGLGLALVKGLVELHGGEAKAASAGPGQGAAFTVLLPVSQPAASTGTPAGGDAPARQPLRILIVEDNRDAAETMRVLLELSGHQVVVAHSGASGVESAREFRPEVVLCDLGLPGMDGLAVARALRQDPATATAHLIAMTGYGSEADQQQCRDAGFDRHLTKPVDPDELQRILAALQPGTSSP